jgi:lysophospholipase L1-like esterase
MLGDKWQVMNCGHSGATLLNNGDMPYQKTGEFQNALNFNPDVVVIMLGTNDSKMKNWIHQDEFVTDYKDLIAKFQDLPGKPHIFIAYPVAAGPNARMGISDGPVKDEQALIDRVVADTGVTLIDLYKPTVGKWELYNGDQVHPINTGATVIAQTVYKALTGQNYAGSTTPPVSPAQNPVTGLR